MSSLRLAHIADSHFDEKNRLDDNVAVHKAFAEQIHDAEVDLVLHAGDFFERRSTPDERNALAEVLDEISQWAPVIGCKGNHDADNDLTIFNRLDGVQIEDRPSMSGIMPAPATLLPVRVLALPWFSKSHLVASLPADTPAVETTERTIQAARGLLSTLRVEACRVAAAGAVPLLVGHVLVAGSETSTGQTLIGSTVELAPSDILEVGCAYAALGHIHKPQSWCDGRVAYSGSVQRLSFGEPEAKGWNLVTIDTERWREHGGVTVEFRPLPAREITLLNFNFADCIPEQIQQMLETPGYLLMSADGEVHGIDKALVRVRYSIKPEDLHLVDEAALGSYARSWGAHSVQLEAVLVHQDRVRCAEIATALDTKAKCAAYWLAKGIDVPEATRARVFAKLDEIEARDRQEVAA